MSTIIDTERPLGVQITISNIAKDQLLAMEVSHKTFLRLWVSSGGCQGLNYQAAIDDEVKAGDITIYHDEHLRVLTDMESAEYLPGLEIDYSDDLVAPGFRFKNPNAKASCGCGSSFCAS